MDLKKREQVLKDLQEIVDNYSGSWQRYDVLSNALTLIKELTEEIKDLEADYDRVYEQAEADIRGNMADGGTSCRWCQDITVARTVKKMQEMLNQRIDRTLEVFDFNISECNAVRQVLRGVKDDVHQVAKELTEDNSNV